MAISTQEEEEQSPSSLLDALYCEEEEQQWEEQQQENPSSCLLPLMLLEQDLFWEDGELGTLFFKEKQSFSLKQGSFDVSLCSDRKEAVEWILKVNACYGFSTLTAIFAVNYLDRFLSSFHFQKDKPWMFQLAATTCLSLAAKVEETRVPLLLDLQVDGTEYYFEAKTIQKMELLVLSTLEWRMNPVTPMSFLDHVIRRLGLKNQMHWEFLRRCEALILCLLSEWKMVNYKPSVLATATMMHVIDQIDPCNSLDYQNQLLSVLNLTKEKVEECYKVMGEKSSSVSKGGIGKKRRYEAMMATMNGSNNNNGKLVRGGNVNEDDEEEEGYISRSPNGVVDYYKDYCYDDYLSSSSESSSDSWEAISNKKTKIGVNENENEPLFEVDEESPLSS